MKMDAVIVSHQFAYPRFDGVSRVCASKMGFDQSHPLAKVLLTTDLWATHVISDDVSQRCARTVAIEGVPHVWDGHVDDAARTKHAHEGLDRPNRILAMLDEMVGDDEI